MTRIRTHPAHNLRAELAERGMSANQLALAIRVPANRITAILRGDRAITAETSVRLGRHIGTGAQFWMNLQSQFDIFCRGSDPGRGYRARTCRRIIALNRPGVPPASRPRGSTGG